MDTRKKAAQATIDCFTKPMLTPVTKNSHGPYSESDTSFCEEQDASNSNSPSPASLRDFINVLPHFEPLHFGFYLMNDDKRASCLCPCSPGVSFCGSSFKIDIENKECCKFHLLQSNGLLRHCQAKGGSNHSYIVYYLKKLDIKPGKAWIDNSTSDGNKKGEDANEEGMYGFVIDREGSHDDEIDNDILANVDGESRFLSLLLNGNCVYKNPELNANAC